MGKLHSKHTVVTINDDDISAYTNSTTFNRTADSHETTGYGVDSKLYTGGLFDGTVTIQGFYDTTAVTGTKAVLQPLLGTEVEFVYQPEGAGSGKPQNVCQVLVTAYNESSPVADIVQWTAELQITGDVDATPQSA